MSIKVSINHKISYQFERQIFLGPHTLRLRPAPHCRTAIQSYSLNINPQDYGITWQQDPYGNFLARLTFPTPSDRLVIDVDIIAKIQPINAFNFFIEGDATQYPFTYETTLAKELIPFLEQTEQGALLQDWVDKHRQTDVYTPTFLVSINQHLAEQITHTVRLESGIQSCAETLTKKIGSCRDTAWLLVQILRQYGLAARFVSGYLIQLKADIPPLDGPTGTDVDCVDLHAWAEVYLPGAGWIGLDPTSGLLAAEGHIPLACTADPATATPVPGTTEPCESKLDFSFTVSRYQETPRVTKPYTEDQWEKINQLGNLIEADLQASQVSLTMGGEPTFVSIDDFESPQWKIEALGTEKRQLAGQLLQRLSDRFSQGGGLLHYGLGKWYPGEVLPRWALGCYWRQDGLPIWRNPAYYAEESQDYGYTQKQAQRFIEALVKHLGVTADCIIPAYELDGEIAGYTLPLLPVLKDQSLRWSSCRWTLPQDQLYLLVGDSPVGFRLPLDSIPWENVTLEKEAVLSLADQPTVTEGEPLESPENSIRIALSVQARKGIVHIFLPPLTAARSFVDLITAIEETAIAVDIPILIEGYTPPGNSGIIGFQITPDPGVIEVNIHPAANWQGLVDITTTLYEEARLSRLGTEKYMLDGRRVSTGGGSHITIGGKTTLDSPLLRRPDLLRSLISYWQNHPSLSYLFSGLFVGPTSQSPRVDEARHESLYDLEIAFQALQPEQNLSPELVDRLLRHLLVDITGNTHRSAFCIDKLFPVENPRNQLGLLEFRAFAMPPHGQMSLLQLLLVRSLVAWFWKHPYTRPLIRWGTMLHDRFMLPYYIGEDLKGVITDLQMAGYSFDFSWFAPFFEFRFPCYGEITREGVQLELRHGIEPWHVLGEETANGSTARYVDSSMERIQVMLRGAIGHSPNPDHVSTRYHVTCNGKLIPLKSTGIPGEYVGAVRYRARQYQSLLHPSIDPHTPLLFEIIDTWAERSIGGCTYYVNPPSGSVYERFPVNHREAESRMVERFVPQGHTSGKVKPPPLELSPEYPLTLDLRQFVY